jgi:hypothetical protein
MLKKIKTWLRGLAAPGGMVALANIAEGTHGDGCITKLADAAIGTRHLLVNFGSDVDHVAVTTDCSEIPLGVVDDEASAAEDNINVQLLGNKQGTILCVSDGTITAMGDMVTASKVAAHNGYVAKLGVGADTYYIIGRALNAAASDGDLVEIEHCVPVQRVV